MYNYIVNIYLDIDGVLLTKYHEPVDGVKEFLERITSTHMCFWLTTHCKDGKADKALEVLGRVYGSDVLDLARKVQPTVWQTFKTEAIDFSEDFRWLDDYVMFYEEHVLKEENVLDKLILIDLQKNPNILKQLRMF